MMLLETQNCNLNRILLLVIGLWPYQQSKFTRFQFIFLFAISLAGIMLQLTLLIILKCTLELVAKILSSVSFFTMFIIEYSIFRFNIEVVKNLLIQLTHIHNKLKDKNEVAIIYKYNCISKRYTVTLIAFGFVGMSISVIAQIWSSVTVVDLPTNISRPYHFLIIVEYFNDQKYFYLLLLHTYIVIYIGIFILLGIGTCFITYIQHICGMFTIASYRIEHAINIEILQNITLKNKLVMIESIICAVDIHRQAMKLSKIFMSKFEIMMSCLIACGVVCLSLNLFQLFQITLFENNANEFILSFLYALISIMHMFIANYIGQNLIDCNNHIFVTAYNVQWYRTPLQIQRMILFLLQRGTKEFTLNVGGLLHGSMENFAMLVKASVSYFTVIYSTR